MQFTAFQVEPPAGKRDDMSVRRARDRCAAQDVPEPEQQFLRVDALVDEIVGAEFQRRGALIVARPCREHDDRCVRYRANFSKDNDAVLIW